jgi:hypothetical protein
MEKLEYFTIMPNLKQFYGKTVTKDTIFDEKTEDGTVEQHFENLTLTTKIKKETEKNDDNPYGVKEETTITITVPEGTILIWDENEGFIVPKTIMTTLDALKEEIDSIDDIYNGE